MPQSQEVYPSVRFETLSLYSLSKTLYQIDVAQAGVPREASCRCEQSLVQARNETVLLSVLLDPNQNVPIMRKN